jgi:hypothetical protein
MSPSRPRPGHGNSATLAALVTTVAAPDYALSWRDRVVVPVENSSVTKALTVSVRFLWCDGRVSGQPKRTDTPAGGAACATARGWRLFALRWTASE